MAGDVEGHMILGKRASFHGLSFRERERVDPAFGSCGVREAFNGVVPGE